MARHDVSRDGSNIIPASQAWASSTASDGTRSEQPDFGMITGSSQKHPAGATQRSASPPVRPCLVRIAAPTVAVKAWVDVGVVNTSAPKHCLAHRGCLHSTVGARRTDVHCRAHQLCGLDPPVVIDWKGTSPVPQEGSGSHVRPGGGEERQPLRAICFGWILEASCMMDCENAVVSAHSHRPPSLCNTTRSWY
eukprot:scaffold98432_cov33-Tisochrysis_lutea.AAC.3